MATPFSIAWTFLKNEPASWLDISQDGNRVISNLTGNWINAQEGSEEDPRFSSYIATGKEATEQGRDAADAARVKWYDAMSNMPYGKVDGSGPTQSQMESPRGLALTESERVKDAQDAENDENAVHHNIRSGQWATRMPRFNADGELMDVGHKVYRSGWYPSEWGHTNSDTREKRMELRP
jgi:hypothetical protein